VPVPTKLPAGNWDTYHEEVETSDFYSFMLKSQDAA
jgi:hypothetical protein